MFEMIKCLTVMSNHVFFRSYPMLIHVLVYDEASIEVCFEMGGYPKTMSFPRGKFASLMISWDPPISETSVRPFGILI